MRNLTSPFNTFQLHIFHPLPLHLPFMDSFLTQFTKFTPIGSPGPAPRHTDTNPPSLATLAIHCDKRYNDNESGDIAPAIHVSTTYHVDNPSHFHYARNDAPTSMNLLSLPLYNIAFISCFIFFHFLSSFYNII